MLSRVALAAVSVALRWLAQLAHVCLPMRLPAPGAELVMKASKAVIVSASKVACGLDFTMWLCNGRVFSAGNPQFGQLGHGSDHEYNASDCESPTPDASSRY